MSWVKVYDERTGDPRTDNRHRAMNRSLHRVCRPKFRVVTPRGRRRKHVVDRIEYERFVRLVAAVAMTAIFDDVELAAYTEKTR